MSKKDERIAELEAQLAHHHEYIETLKLAFQDAIAVIFAETNEHAKHHIDQIEEAGASLEQILHQQAEFLTAAFSGNTSPRDIINAVAEWTEHRPLPSEIGPNGLEGMATIVLSQIVGPNDTIESTIKEALENTELPDEIKQEFHTLLNSGQIDQADARLRDLRNQANANKN